MKLFLALVFLVADMVVAGPTQCNVCDERDADTCSLIQRNQTCVTDRDSLGTTHCGSAAIKYLGFRNVIEHGIIQGCFDCTDKKAACFALGGYLKDRRLQTLLQCEIECCTASNCNTQVPTLSNDAITVFSPNASGPKECNLCLENNATSCSKNQETHTCATDPTTLGTTHCGSAVGRYRDSKGNVVDGFIRGCINCEDKKAACAALGGFLKGFRRWTQLECEMECCTGDNCNTQIPILSKGGDPTTNRKPNAAAGQKDTLFNGVLIFATIFRVILHHI